MGTRGDGQRQPHGSVDPDDVTGGRSTWSRVGPFERIIEGVPDSTVEGHEALGGLCSHELGREPRTSASGRTSVPISVTAIIAVGSSPRCAS